MAKQCVCDRCEKETGIIDSDVIPVPRGWWIFNANGTERDICPACSQGEVKEQLEVLQKLVANTSYDEIAKLGLGLSLRIRRRPE